MDEVWKLIESSLNISSMNISGISHSRLLQYKNFKGKVSTQDDRRQEVLQEQKKRRDDVLAKFRGLFESNNNLFEEIEKEKMEWSQTKMKKKKICRKKFEVMKQLMFSEWLLDIPCDLDTDWLVKPCPVGQRVLLITQGGRVLSYSKRGTVLKCSSWNLFNVNTKVYTHFGYIVLDCIYNSSNDTHYVLDVLNWKFPMLSSTAEFRFYWLENKFREILQNSDGPKIELLAYYPASQLTKLMEMYPIFPNNCPQLDGLLLYHKLGFYEPGVTPLVGWIKPFMIPETLNIPVNQQYYNEKNCDDITQLMEEENQRYYTKSKRKRKSQNKIKDKNQMELEDNSEVSACPASSAVE